MMSTPVSNAAFSWMRRIEGAAPPLLTQIKFRRFGAHDSRSCSRWEPLPSLRQQTPRARRARSHSCPTTSPPRSTGQKRPACSSTTNHDAVARNNGPAVRATFGRDIALKPAMPPSVKSTHRLLKPVASDEGAEVLQGVKLCRPKIDSATERKVRKQLAKGVGILKVAKSLGLGTGSVQRISKERAMSP